MGVKLMEFGIYMTKGVIFTIRGCYRSVCNHPFFVCVLCALMYMSRSYPFMFSLLVSASPVLVCTAVLLGTLLFYGQQNIMETEKDKETTYEAVALKTELSTDANVDECIEKYSEDKRDGVEKVAVESGLLVNKLDEIRVGGNVDGAAALSKERISFGIESENGENWEADGEVDDSIQQKKSEWNEERLGDGDGEVMMDHYAIISKVIGELLESESEHEKSEGDSSDSEVHRHKDEEEEGDDDALDSGSDGAESSSPDASVDGMMPMLDELHPLLDEDAVQPVQTEQSPRSSISSIESGDETEVHDSEVADDDEAQDDKEDQIKPIITWTEEDQKNLMDVGSSEIERNQRLERILKRRRNMSMVPEINLIDFENPDFQFHIAPISTGGRQNPFDLPHDSYDNSVPGSAPSVLSQRRNPFDIPDDSSEGDQNEMAEEFREELRSSQLRHPFFRRRAVGPSIFSPNRLERRPVKLRPFFVPEQAVSEESSYSPLHHESSGVSSVHETESMSSVEYLEDQKLDEADVPQDQDQVSKDVPYEQEHVGHGSQSSEDKELLKSGSNSVAVAPYISRQTSAEIADLSVATTLADDVPHREPVYDTSPSAAGKNYSSSSSFSDVHAEPDKRTQGEVPSSSSHCNDKKQGDLEDEKNSPNSIEGQLQVEHSVDNGETVGAAYHEANENLNSTHSARENSSHFYDKAKNWLGFGHQDEVQVPNAPVEGIQDSVEVEAGKLDS